MSSLNTFDEVVFCPRSTDANGFGVDLEWLERVKADGVVCHHCENVRPAQKNRVQNVVVRDLCETRAHCGFVSSFGLGHALSKVFIETLGRKTFDRVGRFVPIASAQGRESQTHELFIGYESRGHVRGPHPDKPGLCKACGRLLYWPGWPPSIWYIMRSDWKTTNELGVLGDWLIVPELVGNRPLEKLNLENLVFDRVAIVETPRDGLPSEYNDFVTWLEKNGVRK